MAKGWKDVSTDPKNIRIGPKEVPANPATE